MKNNLLHILLAGALLVFLALLTDPFMLWMPPMAVMAVLVGIAVLLCVWSAFVMFERADDERETLHRLRAGRAAYLAGVSVLTVGLLWQGIVLHAVDPWIAAALGTIVLVKLVTGLYASTFR